MIEKVNIRHQDKICDLIADTTHAYLYNLDSGSYCSIDVTYNSGSYQVVGQIDLSEVVDKPLLKVSLVESLKPLGIEETVKNINLDLNPFPSSSLYNLNNNLAIDNCVSTGYACREHPSFLPYEVQFTAELTSFIPSTHRWKSICSLKENELSIDFTTNYTGSNNLIEFYKKYCEEFSLVTGSCTITNSSFDDEELEYSNGMSGVKLHSDLYGSKAGTPSGPLSGRDIHQIDKVSTFYARKLARDYMLSNTGSQEVFIEMAYKKGQEQPLYVKKIEDGTETYITGSDFSVNKMVSELNKTTFVVENYITPLLFI